MAMSHSDAWLTNASTSGAFTRSTTCRGRRGSSLSHQSTRWVSSSSRVTGAGNHNLLARI
jgi:hypothetical protein